MVEQSQSPIPPTPEMQQAQSAAAGQTRASLLEGLAPADVDFVPPLIHSIRLALHLLGKGVSVAWLMSGLGVGADKGKAPSIAECLRSARRAGLKSHIAERTTIETISPLTLL